MGKPFLSELEKLDNTLQWSTKQDVSELAKELIEDNMFSLFVVGSGGSLSVCYYVVELYQRLGLPAKAVTPLELIYSKTAIANSKIIFISASGKNTDILFAFSIAIQQEPKRIINICMRPNSPLSIQSSQYTISTIFDYKLPSGKDGFLATNSLLAFMSLFAKAFNQNTFSPPLNDDITFKSELDSFFDSVSPDFTFIVLHAGWSTPVAIDIESKLAEAALGNVLLTDYRNFGHGRHHWFDKRGKKSAIIALVTPTEMELADKTLSLLPSNIPVLKIKSGINSNISTLELIKKSFLFVNKLGKAQNIDPGRPGVPSYGSKLYHLNYKRFFKIDVSNWERQVSKKLSLTSLNEMHSNDKQFWKNAYDKFVDKLQSELFGAIVFDYDGTLCSSKNRFVGIDKLIVDDLIKFLKKGIIIGVATGRGQSVRQDLQRVIPKQYWNKIIIGYYNCSQIATLDDELSPNKKIKSSKVLTNLFASLQQLELPYKIIPELKGHQISIEAGTGVVWSLAKNSVIDFIRSKDINGIQILESSHSIDVVESKYSNKVNIISKCEEAALKTGLYKNCLCIGDKGKWPGNDYQLLSTDYSLSVDETSSLPESCWNLAPLGIKNVEATKYYISCLTFKKNGLNFKLE